MIVYGNAISVLVAPALFAQNQGMTEKEAALGRQMAADFRQHSTTLASRAVQDFVDSLGRKLVSQMPTSRFAFTFSVIAEDPCPTIHEPYAVPGGYVFVPAALFAAAQDESEFAGMLAHAMAHIVDRNPTQQARRGKPIQSAVTPFVGCTSAPGPVGFLKVQRTLERQADVLAVQMLAQAGFDPNALVRYTERVQPPMAPTATALSPLAPKDVRIASIVSEIAKLPRTGDAIVTTGEFEGVREEVHRLLPSNRSTPPSLMRKSAR